MFGPAGSAPAPAAPARDPLSAPPAGESRGYSGSGPQRVAK